MSVQGADCLVDLPEPLSPPLSWHRGNVDVPESPSWHPFSNEPDKTAAVSMTNTAQK